MLEFDTVHFGYRPGREVLEGVSFRAEAGEVLVVLGPNGSGKSTLLRLAAGLLRPARGRVLLEGRETSRLSRKEAASLAALSDASFEDAPLPVGQVLLDAAFVREGGFLSETPSLKEKVERAVEEFELQHLLDRRIGELSSGERGRLSLARVVIQDSPLILLDEPSGRLDFRHRERLVEKVRALAEAGKTVVVVEHNLDVALRLADRVLVLKDGKSTAWGRSSEVLRADVLGEAFEVRFVSLESETGPVLLPRGIRGDAAPSGDRR